MSERLKGSPIGESNTPQNQGLRGKERSAALASFVENEIRRFHAGKVEDITTLPDLAEKFGYPRRRADSGTVYRILKRRGLDEERRLIRESIDTTIKEIIPSREWAWMLGLLAVGGHIMPNGKIQLVSQSKELVLACKNTGEQVFGANAQVSTRQMQGKEYGTIHFNNAFLGREIGDLKREQWPLTVTQRHSWILQDPNFGWAFLEGVFEKSGRVAIRPEYRWIDFSTTYPAVADFLSDLLSRVGIEYPAITTRQDFPEGVSGVRIRRISDIKIAAANIHSVIPEKEAKLEYFRKITLP